MSMDMRSPLQRVRGLGSAKEGVHHWWLSRMTSLALIPLTVWFAVSIIGLAGAPVTEVRAWLANPFSAVMMVLTLGVSFHHGASGLQVVIEDYVHHEGAKLVSIVAVKAIAFILALVGIFAVLKVAFGG